MKLIPGRSLLYLPGSNARALAKLPQLKADAYILDLEDAVAPQSKVTARQALVEFLQHSDRPGRRIMVRVNALDTPWGKDDIRAFSSLPLDALVLPKVESAVQLHDYLEIMDSAADSTTNLPVWIMTETPRGVLQADSVYSSSARIAGVIMGTSDLAKEMRLPPDPLRTGLVPVLSACVTAARANGLEIIDGVHLNFRDLNEFRMHCDQARLLGFDGKSLIHPSQIELCHEIFSPTSEQVAHAQRIMQAWQQAQAENSGVCVVDGRLVENLHVDEAARLLELWALINPHQD